MLSIAAHLSPLWANSRGIQPHTVTLQIHQSLELLHFFAFIYQFIHSTEYQKYMFGLKLRLKSSHLKIWVNGAGVYTTPRSVS